ncbi:MAG: DUF1919 domain-containing protein [Prevotella sp.]|nr:DUF1919 domain-containing protein [Prevotella sp.]
MTYEGLRLRFRNNFLIPVTRNFRAKNLRCKDFTIISNNCWAGTIYESYNMPKLTPTVGMFFMAKDYIEFLSQIKDYLQCDLHFIDPFTSRAKTYASHDKRFGSYPVGIIGGGDLKDVEIMFLHYHSEKEAKEKWERRCKRINWEHLLVKFNDQNLCTEDDIRTFDSLPFKHKICFSVKKYPQYKSVVTIKVPKSHEYIRASYEPFGRARSININTLLNGL